MIAVFGLAQRASCDASLAIMMFNNRPSNRTSSTGAQGLGGTSDAQPPGQPSSSLPSVQMVRAAHRHSSTAKLWQAVTAVQTSGCRARSPQATKRGPRSPGGGLHFRRAIFGPPAGVSLFRDAGPTTAYARPLHDRRLIDTPCPVRRGHDEGGIRRCCAWLWSLPGTCLPSATAVRYHIG